MGKQVREIKFRMFDTLEKNFMNGSRVIESRINDLNKGGRFVYQQWTGLKDKNGKEIYEGDIISYPDAYYSSSENGEEFEVFENKGVIEYCSEELRYYVTNKQSIDDEQIFDDEIEVIGNIYENPELLEAK